MGQSLASLQKSNRSVTWAVGRHVPSFTSHSFPMPKIKTTRTKKAPDGFEEIEPVGIVLLPMEPPLIPHF